MHKNFSVNTVFISLSGPFDVTDRMIKKYLDYNQNRQNSYNALLEKVNKIFLANPAFNKAQYARLNLMTERFLCNMNNQRIILKNGQIVEDAIENKVSKNEIASDYSCCERKIFSVVQNITGAECYLFTKFKPCKKCRPAIKKFLNNTNCNMKIFYYENGTVEEYDMSNL